VAALREALSEITFLLSRREVAAAQLAGTLYELRAEAHAAAEADSQLAVLADDTDERALLQECVELGACRGFT
jgi:hypothetical protein